VLIPIIDTAGRSGTSNKDKAKEITNDILHCEYLAKKHYFFSNVLYWTVSPTDTKYEIYYEKMFNCKEKS
jgi:hypothetical protein